MTQNPRLSMLSLALALALALLLGSSATAGDWPCWRGLDGSGVSSESDWNAEGRPDSLWSMNVGLGYTSFVVSNGRVITAGYSEADGGDTIYCLDALSGKKIWTHSYPSKKWDKYHEGGTQSTPTIVGDHVYALNREGGMFCLDFDDGRVIWQKNLKEDFDLDYPEWMFSASPLVIDDRVYVNVGRTVALNRADGSTIWETRKTGDAYSTPQPIDLDGRAGLAVFNSDGLTVFSQADGSDIASHGWKTKYDINAATPIVIGNRIFISSGQNRGCCMLELNDGQLDVVWEKKLLSTKMTGCVLYKGHLYGFDDTMLECLDTEGNEKWRKRGLGMGTLMLAGGRLIVVSAKGELIIAEATPDEYTELSRAKVLDEGVYWSMPILANGLIYCRNNRGDVVCRDHRSSDSTPVSSAGTGTSTAARTSR